MTAKFNGTAEKVLAYASSAEKKQQTLLQQMGKANLGWEARVKSISILMGTRAILIFAYLASLYLGATGRPQL